MLAFWQKYGPGPADAQVSRDEHLREMTGGFTLLKVTQDTGSHLVASLKDGHGGYAEITLELASTDPPVIRSIVGRPVPPPASERSPSSNDQELLAEVNKHVAELLSQGHFSGAVLIAHHGKPILDQAWGLADREKNIKNTTETQFCIGSMNKMFTAIAVLQLVHEGKLSLDGTLAEYWPNYPNHDLASKVTIRQLLTHTGGTGDIFTPEYDAHRLETRTLDDYIKLFGQRDLRFQPGSKFEYSNYGFILLGRLIEIVAGTDYDSYVQKQIYGPAGMTHTSSRPQADQAPARAVGYMQRHMQTAGGLQPNTGTLPWSGTSAGGGYSTTGDLLRFANALQAGKLLDPELLKEATSDQSHANYGFGFSAFKDGSYGHGGGAPGVNGELRIFPTGYVVVVLENLDPPAATVMENFIEARLPLE
jgi:CubicO group peptidase (beta-lactamase class C family)